ncbi:hypothetical protein HPB51_023513 [Rhipicephalus microplus]|uniref:Uncharacterized protein n=1 Tax=Rhipicephalus microplus TaxID=6941 RepID=A0A9J6EJF3_RHIMP|nr:hypothetical protein HPB51_023513 [Rhipicephalus microplus]
MTMQFEWDGCTFYRYIPVETKRTNGSHMTPGRSFIPLLPFVTPTLEWCLKTSSTSTRRRKQQLVSPLGLRSRCGRQDRYIQKGQEAVRGAVSSWLWRLQRLSSWVPQVVKRDHATPGTKFECPAQAEREASEPRKQATISGDSFEQVTTKAPLPLPRCTCTDLHMHLCPTTLVVFSRLTHEQPRQRSHLA